MADTVQVNATLPEALWRPFKVLLAQRGQTYAQWLRDHMQAALRDEERRQALLRAKRDR